MRVAGPPQGANVPLEGQTLACVGELPARLDLPQAISTAAISEPKQPHPLKRRNASGTKILRRPVHGVLLLDKPIGLSSNQALQKAKWLLRADKAGHTGTLDPLATGVLPLCFGAATKFSQLQLDADKTYEAVLLLGTTTTTADAEGDVLQTRPVPPITDAQLRSVASQFTGPLDQVPPMYSALKKDGKALYEYARQGITVERAARSISVYSLDMAFAHDSRAEFAIKIIVRCSKGTYIRTLGEDIGEVLGCGAHIGTLRRIETGGFESAQCVTLAALEAMTESERDACLLPAQVLVAAYPAVTLDAENAARFLSGLPRTGRWGKDAPFVQVYASNCGRHDSNASFLGTAQVVADALIPLRLLSAAEVRDMLPVAPVSGVATLPTSFDAVP